MKKYLLILIVLIGTNIQAQNLTEFLKKTDAFLSANVKNGKVDYAKIYKNPETLYVILEIAKDISVSESNQNNYKAFWINAYNLSVIKGIIDNYPIKSPLDNEGFFDKITYNIGGKKITLNDIENKMLRAKFKDPLFHFVLVCGAIGCPPLINNAYMPNTLDAQMANQASYAINGDFIRVNKKKKRIEVSEILKWYKEDFTLNGTTELEFINTYLKEDIPEDYKLSYFKYNWNLNKQ